MEPCDFCNRQKQSLGAGEDTGLEDKQEGPKGRSLNLNAAPEQNITMGLQRFLIALSLFLKQFLLHNSLN